MKHLVVLCLLFLFQKSPAQVCCLIIEELKVIPERPTDTDSLRIAVKAWTSRRGARIYFTWERTPNSVSLEECYSISNADEEQTYYHEVPIGVFDTGSYVFNYKAFLTDHYPNCLPGDSILLDTGFIVQKYSPAKNVSKESEIKIFPNPSSSGEFLIKSESLVEKVRVLNVNRVLIFQKESFSSLHPNINLSGQPPGLYFLAIMDKNGNTHLKKLIKQ